MMTRFKVLQLLCIPVLAACSQQDESNTYCEAHQQRHSSHLEIVTTVQIEHKQAGELEASIEIPHEALTEPVDHSMEHGRAELVSRLRDVDQVFEIESASTCSEVLAQAEEINGQVSARYQFDCGADNKLNKISVVLFDNFPEIQEVEVRMTTPAVQKHFVINRQCSAAMFIGNTGTEENI
jgi:hypothetical protein